jgi:hypothetical protein
LKSLRQAVAIGGEMARALLRNDPRFAPLQNIPVFRALVPPLPSSSSLELPF